MKKSKGEGETDIGKKKDAREAENKPRRCKADLWRKPGKLALLRGWAKDGASYDEIAARMHVSRSTLSLWRDKYPEIGEALEYGREEADYAVEHSLFERCRERTVRVTRMIKLRRVEYDDDGKKVKEYDELVPTEEEQLLPADTAAIKYWLSQRRPERWSANEQTVPDEEETGVLLLPEVLPEEDKP